MEEKKTYYVTTPIYYPSDNFHVGHCYTTCIADVLARYKRAQGYDVFFLTGSDEHGQKIEGRAKKKGVSPKEFVDPIIEDAKDLWRSLNISYDKFIRTTDSDHIACVQKVFQKLYDQGDIYKGYYEGYYCTPCEAFWTESQLVDGKCPDCGRAVGIAKEEAYFLRLSKYQKQLEDYLAANRDLMQPESRYHEMVNNFLKPGLKDLCVSRSSVKWGIPVTFDPDQTVYVWVDALTNYISALGYLSADDRNFQKYWPADLHLVGKEIFRFHTIIWPIILMALGLPLPKKVYGHGWLTIDGGKISKSRGNYKDPRLFIKDYGADTLRYFILSEVPFGNDGNFSELLMVQRRNSDLVNILGNLVNRTIAMANKYFGGKIEAKFTAEAVNREVSGMINNLAQLVEQKMAALDSSAALKAIFALLSRLNKYIDETAPWVLARDEAQKERLEAVLYLLLEGIRVAAIELAPFIPTTAEKIFALLNTADCSFEDAKVKTSAYQVTSTPEILFTRIDEKALAAKLAAEEKKAQEKNDIQSAKADISLADFEKAELVVGKIIQAKKHPNADKLLVLTIDLGHGDIREIVSSLAKRFTCAELNGQKVIVAANLLPAEIRGIVSRGMILVAQDKDKYELLTSSCAIGTRIK